MKKKKSVDLPKWISYFSSRYEIMRKKWELTNYLFRLKGQKYFEEKVGQSEIRNEWFFEASTSLAGRLKTLVFAGDWAQPDFGVKRRVEEKKVKKDWEKGRRRKTLTRRSRDAHSRHTIFAPLSPRLELPTGVVEHTRKHTAQSDGFSHSMIYKKLVYLLLYLSLF